MDTYLIPKHDRMLIMEPSATISSCVFCGSEFGSINFKGRCVCEECLTFVKDLL